MTSHLNVDVDLDQVLRELASFMKRGNNPFTFKIHDCEYELSLKKVGYRCDCGELMQSVNTPCGIAYACIRCYPEYADKVVESSEEFRCQEPSGTRTATRDSTGFPTVPWTS